MIHIWTDGACDPDTRNGGWAAHIVREGDVWENLSGAVLDTTNNRMEYTAIIKALEWVYGYCKPEDHIEVHSDSLLVLGHMSGEYRVKKNVDLVNTLKSWVANEATPHVTLSWHKRNSTPELQWCDKQAKYEKKSLDTEPRKRLTLGRTP